MVSRQALTITPDGGVAGLQVKPGRGFDLRQMGKASVERASEVLWDEERQVWYVEVREKKFAGKNITAYLMYTAGVDFRDINPVTKADGTLYFTDYDDAVACEIAVLDGLRHKGLL